MDGFQLFRVMGREAREVLNGMKHDLRDKELKERREGLARLRMMKSRREEDQAEKAKAFESKRKGLTDGKHVDLKTFEKAMLRGS